MRAPIKHPAAAGFAKSGIFDGLQRFCDFEARVSALETAKERGDVFEVFAAAYLATQRHMQASEVWPEKDLPAQIRTELRLPADDQGVDGVFRDSLDRLNTYQVLFPSPWDLTYTAR